MRDANLQEIIEKVTGEGDQLRKQTEFWKMVLEGSYDGICIVDGNANLVWMNSAYEKIAGLKEVDVIGKNLKELVEKGAMSCACSLLALEKKKVVTLEQVFRNGKRATVTSTPLFDEVGKIQMVVVNVRDISDIYRMQRKLEERFLQLSLRKHQKFIKVNCATIPDSLAESELFGRDIRSLKQRWSQGFMKKRRGPVIRKEYGNGIRRGAFPETILSWNRHFALWKRWGRRRKKLISRRERTGA